MTVGGVVVLGATLMFGATDMFGAVVFGATLITSLLMFGAGVAGAETPDVVDTPDDVFVNGFDERNDELVVPI